MKVTAVLAVELSTGQGMAGTKCQHIGPWHYLSSR